jgi:HK97 family phage major capsid protein
MSTKLNRAITPGMRDGLRARGIDPEEIGRVRNNAPTLPKDFKIPTNPADLEDCLQDRNKMAAIFQEKGMFGEFVRNYATNVLKQDQEIATQVREETQRVVRDMLKDQRPEEVERVNLAGNLRNPYAAGHTGLDVARRGGLYNKNAMGAKIDQEFPTTASYFQAIWHNAQRDAALQAKMGRVRDAFSSTVPNEGGFLIPETLRSELLRVSLETSIVRPRARVIPMETLRVPFPSVDSTSNVGSVYGGIVGYWTEEGGQLTASQANFGRIVLEAKKLTAYTEVPNELLSDSGISFEAFINDIFPEALGFYEDDAFTNGNGAGLPLGYLKADAAVSVTKEAGQPATSIVWENIVKMFARMLPSSLGRAVWVASVDTFPELATMALAVGTGGSPVWLNNGVAGPPMTILGRPVIFTEKAPTVGTAGDINFVDFGFYLIGDRQVMSASSSPHYKFGSDVTAYKIIERVDGRPWLQNAITPKNNGATLSPFVKIETRA